jgi:acyl-CoA synthetase (AMP-forming)/AMP-acid ligase II
MPAALAFISLNDDGKELKRWTYADLDEQAQCIASSLKGTDGHVLVLCPPGLQFVAALFGCFYAGRVAVPAPPPTSKQAIPRLQHIVKDAGVATVLTTKSVAEEFCKISASVPDLEALQWIYTDTQPTRQRDEKVIGENDLAILQYTSGSTGDPLGTMVTHKNLIVNSGVIAKAFQHNRESVGVIWLPPYHDMGLVGGILQPVYVGFPCVLMPPMTIVMRPIRWLRAISHYRATTSGGPNFAFDICSRKIPIEDCGGLDLSCWRAAFNGAEPINADTLDRFSRKFAAVGFRKEAFLPCYGLAEATLCATCDDSTRRPHVIQVEEESLGNGKIVVAHQGVNVVGCGVPARKHDCRIVDPDSGQEKAPGQVGEIWLKGSSIAAGYWNRPKLTREMFHARLPDHDGHFLRTGDLGAMVDGALFVLGRIKNLMIIRGRKYHPHDIEASIRESLQNFEIDTTAVFSVNVDGCEQLVVAQETRVPARDSDTLDKIIRAIRRAVFGREQLQVAAVVLLKRRALPKTFSGKLQSARCRQMYLNKQLVPLKAWP